MQHQVTKVKFGRNTNQRKALLRSLLRELILREKLETSLEKAKWLKKEIDKVITAAKKGDKNWLVSKILNDNESQEKILSLVPRFKSRNSGFTRIYHLGERKGDNAHMAKIELIFDEESASSGVAKRIPSEVEGRQFDSPEVALRETKTKKV